jgi:hypothetical protein
MCLKNRSPGSGFFILYPLTTGVYLYMEFKFEHLLPAGFSPASRVWVYQCTRSFTPAETTGITDRLGAFTNSWLSHGSPVKGAAVVLPEGFILLLADETATGVSGCSTDSSVRIIREIENTYQISLFDRQLLAFYINNEVARFPLAHLTTLLADNRVNEHTLYFNNMVQTLAELRTEWLAPAGKSWLAAKMTSPV